MKIKLGKMKIKLGKMNNEKKSLNNESMERAKGKYSEVNDWVGGGWAVY